MKYPQGRTIAALRAGTGLSQKRLAECAGCTGHHLSRIERGRRRPGPTLLRRLLMALGQAEETRP